MDEYYRLLGLSADSTTDDIKRAFRSKAREWHPDINHNPEAAERFIAITEAYDFLIAYHEKLNDNKEAFEKAMEDWERYRRNISRRRAYAYSRSSYSKFRNSNLYRTTRIFNGTAIIYGFTISVLVILYTITGYVYRVRHPLPDNEQPTFLAFLALLSLGILFFLVSFVYLKNYIAENRRRKNKTEKRKCT